MYLIVFVFIGCVFILWYFVLQFCLYFSILVMFFKCSWCVLICECTLFVLVVDVLFSFFIVFVNFSNIHWFSVKIKVSDWVERNFFSLIVFGGNLLVGDVHSSVTMDRHVQVWQWIGSIYLLIWGLPWASACSLVAWSHSLGFLLLER